MLVLALASCLCDGFIKHPIARTKGVCGAALTKSVVSSFITSIPIAAGKQTQTQTQAANHVAFIVDGNGRWGESNNMTRSEGHSVGANVTVEITKAAFEQGVEYISLYLFSTENWKRSSTEISHIMKLLEDYLLNFSQYLLDNKIKLRIIGQTNRLPFNIQVLSKNIGYKSEENGNKTLILAISYGGRDDILNACKNIVHDVNDNKVSVDDIDEDMITSNLSTGLIDVPDPDIVIRTSGELRLSNFMLWQCAYSELAPVNCYWPDFKVSMLTEILAEYSKRHRRFGGV